ncbi:FkbM family methyltransferase [Bradyrhizobium sp. CCBAU 11386]|uniref:FkbM family methyltransferase n=1 Tax=Bradyrhizobium sp. CCBAU 11386 TaxID=1630837 RepID=UPI002304525F|nr:FkbM family methyltransferase [Bradyrhizobium sp. CCBAU 11386]
MSMAIELKPESAKAFARFLYARVPGAAQLRFAIKDLVARYVSKPEFGGVSRLGNGGGLIIDVGANRGQSIAAFRRLRPDCDVVAFEPEPRSAARLISRYQGDRRVTIHDCALGQRAGQLTFFIPRYGRWDCDGMAATSQDEATQWLRDRGRMFRFDETRLTVTEHAVQCRTLDSFRLSPMLIKLHAQGAELDILKGSQETLRRCAPPLMCAFPGRELVDFLRQFDYDPYLGDGGDFAQGLARPGATFTWFYSRTHLEHPS